MPELRNSAFPARTPGDTAGASPDDAQAESGSDGVLLVDDEPTILRLFCSMLEDSMPDVRVDCAGNGAEAIEKFGQTRHEVMVMDLCMPVMDGQRTFFEIEKMCQAQHWSMPAVVFCSAFTPPLAVRERIAGNPRHCVLHKPVFNSELVDAVRARLHTQP